MDACLYIYIRLMCVYIIIYIYVKICVLCHCPRVHVCVSDGSMDVCVDVCLFDRSVCAYVHGADACLRIMNKYIYIHTYINVYIYKYI